MDDFTLLLRKRGLRATTGRLALLQLLRGAGKPLTIRDILKRSKGRLLNQATLYRALEGLTEAGLVARADLGTGVAHYEYGGGTHHHHMVCRQCGVLEDVESPALERVLAQAASSSRRFKSIYSHNVEWFGTCRACSK